VLIGIFGRRYQGKTTLAINVADDVERRAILDPRGLVRRPGAVVVRSVGALRQAFAALADDDFAELVYTPIESHPFAFEAFAAELRRWIVEHPDLELAVVVDEASFYGALDGFDDFMFAIKSCDVERFTTVITVHRPTELAVDVRALLNRWAIFRTTQEHDLDVVKKRCGADVAALVQELTDREYVEWDDDDGTYDVNRSPFIWYSELTPPGAERSILVLA